MNMVSSNINQWTLLAAMLPIVYSISRGTPSSIPFDDHQKLEILMTLGQSLVGMLFLVNMKLTWWEASSLFSLWFIQFIFSPMTPGPGFFGFMATHIHWYVTVAYLGVVRAGVIALHFRPETDGGFSFIWSDVAAPRPASFGPCGKIGQPIPMSAKIRSTTVLCVRRDGKVVMAGDGQVTFGQEILKASAHKLRRLYHGKILAGFAGSTADAFALFARFESKLETHGGNLARSVVELAKDWRTDRALRHLEALLLVADTESTYIVSGSGDVIEPDEGVAAIGSGGPFAKAASLALMANTPLGAREIAEKSMEIAGKICIYTNHSVTYEELG